MIAALSLLAFTTGDLVRAKPSKIVSGQESERTNEFLQILSIAILKQVGMCVKWWGMSVCVCVCGGGGGGGGGGLMCGV